jgi:NitT/TauT family transport system ATP-binding protein
VEEAVFLGDEIVCLSARPAEVHQIVRVDMPRPRDRTSPELNKIRKEILSLMMSQK